MGYTIPNQADAFNTRQAEPDKVDLDILAAAMAGTGVVSGGAVTWSSALIFAVAAGSILVAGEPCVFAAGNVTLAAADGTNPRFDLIVVSNAGVRDKTTGTAAAVPVFPAIPASSVVLAAIYVPANETTSAANRITDKRAFVASSVVGTAGMTLGSGKGDDAVATIGATSKAIATTLYGSQGAEIVPVPIGAYSLQLPLSPFAATVTSSGNFVFAFQNGWVRRMRIRRISLQASFNGTAAATTSQFLLVRFAGGTFAAGTSLFSGIVAKRNATPISQLLDCRYILSTTAGLTLPASAVVGQPFAVVGAPRQKATACACLKSQMTLHWHSPEIFELDTGEGFGFKLGAAAVVGDALQGCIEWDEIPL